jgi:hypothetical protein
MNVQVGDLLVKILMHSLFLSNKPSLSLRTIGPFKALLIILTISVLIPTGCAVRRTLPPSQSDQSNNPTDIHPTSEPAEKDREDQKWRRAELQQRRWVDSVYALLNDTTRITQLFMPAVSMPIQPNPASSGFKIFIGGSQVG